MFQHRLILNVFDFDNLHKNDPHYVLAMVKFESLINTTKAYQETIWLPSKNIMSWSMLAQIFKSKIKEANWYQKQNIKSYNFRTENILEIHPVWHYRSFGTGEMTPWILDIPLSPCEFDLQFKFFIRSN